MTVIDLDKLSDRALIALADGLTRRWEIEVVEARNAYFPEIGDTTAGDLDLHDAIVELLYARGNGSHRFCRNHLLPLTHPDGCDRCGGLNNNIEEN